MRIKTKWTWGFTLAELMIVMAIIGLISSAAYPSYQQYLVRANRAVAQQFLMEAASAQHQYFLANNGNGYATELVLFGVRVNGCYPNGDGLLSPNLRVCEFYRIRNVPQNSNTTFYVRAIPDKPGSGAIQNGDGTLEIHQDGQKVGTW
jgi:prepilin-type N-terminal cleavage/methylation domain-containing protein